MPVTLPHSPSFEVAPGRLSPRAFHVCDKAVIHPAARYARGGWVCKRNRVIAEAISEIQASKLFFLCPTALTKRAASRLNAGE
jgi:hypothetical protein